MKRLVLIVAAGCVVLTAGCAKPGGGSPSSASSISSVAESADALPRLASIPGMEFVAESGVRGGGAIGRGSSIAAGSYTPAVTGRSITSVQWVVVENDGINQPALTLRFGKTGAKELAKLTGHGSGTHVLVVLDHRVLDSVAVGKHVTDGMWTLDAAGVLAARSQIDSATVPSK